MSTPPRSDPHRPPSRTAVILFLSLFVLGLLLQASVVFAEGTLTVDDDGADCPAAGYTTVQAAVDAAQPGDTVLVHDAGGILPTANAGRRTL